MSAIETPYCPECLEAVDRRDFMRVVGSGATALAVGGVLTPAIASVPGKTPVLPSNDTGKSGVLPPRC